MRGGVMQRNRGSLKRWRRLAPVVVASLVGVGGLESLAETAEQASPQSGAAPQAPLLDFAVRRAALVGRCGDCHGEAEGEGGFSLTRLATEGSLFDAADEWLRMRQRLADGSMPPDDAEPIPLDERRALVHWVDGAIRDAACGRDESAGPPMFRRLTAHEYSNTIRDLLHVNFDAGHGLPQDMAGGEGFDNAAETATISPLHAEGFLRAATEALVYAASDSAARQALLAQRPSEERSEQEAAQANLGALASRAFRRPVTSQEAAPFVRLYRGARAGGMNFDQATYYAMRGVLTSPQFLFLAEEPPAKRTRDEPLSDWELASRLSYFLWATMPDDALRKAADEGRLRRPEELRAQVERMLGDGARLDDSLVQFVGQWLGTADLGRTKQVDPRRYPWIQDHHVAAMRNQPAYEFESLVRRNRSLLELIDADWTFVNSELLAVYQMDGSKLKKKQEFSQQLRRVGLPAEYRYRGGVLGSGAVLATTAYPSRSSPVLRGAWVFDKMLGAKIPPPPPQVPKLDESPEAVKTHSQRERLEQHRADPACATCHDRIDPIGFALENFDELGRWRDHDEGGAVDAVAELNGGIKIEGVAGLQRFLLENKEQFARHLVEKMLGYALARGLRPSDRASVERIVARLEANDYKARELILGIVESKPFQFKGTAP